MKHLIFHNTEYNTSLFPGKVTVTGDLEVTAPTTPPIAGTRHVAEALAETEATRLISTLNNEHTFGLFSEHRPEQIRTVFENLPEEPVSKKQAEMLGDIFYKLENENNSNFQNRLMYYRSNMVKQALVDYIVRVGLKSDDARSTLLNKLSDAHRIKMTYPIWNSGSEGLSKSIADLDNEKQEIYSPLLAKIFIDGGNEVKTAVLNIPRWREGEPARSRPIFNPTLLAMETTKLICDPGSREPILSAIVENPDSWLSNSIAREALPLITDVKVLEQLASVAVKSNNGTIKDLYEYCKKGVHYHGTSLYEANETAAEALIKAMPGDTSYERLENIFDKDVADRVFTSRKNTVADQPVLDLKPRTLTLQKGELQPDKKLIMSLGESDIKVESDNCLIVIEILEHLNIDPELRKEIAQHLLPKVELEEGRIKVIDGKREVYFDFNSGCFDRDFLSSAIAYIYAVRESDLSDDIKEKFELALFPEGEFSSDDTLSVKLLSKDDTQDSRLSISKDTGKVRFSYGHKKKEASDIFHFLAFLNLMRSNRYKDRGEEFFLNGLRDLVNIEETSPNEFSVSAIGKYKSSSIQATVNLDNASIVGYKTEPAILPLITHLELEPKCIDGQALNQLLRNLKFDLKIAA